MSREVRAAFFRKPINLPNLARMRGNQCLLTNLIQGRRKVSLIDLDGAGDGGLSERGHPSGPLSPLVAGGGVD